MEDLCIECLLSLQLSSLRIDMLDLHIYCIYNGSTQCKPTSRMHIKRWTCFLNKPSSLVLRTLLNEWNCSENRRWCADDGRLLHWAMTAFILFFFFSFFKKCRDLAELYTAGRCHVFTRGRSPAWTSHLLSTPRLPLYHRKPPLCYGARGKGTQKWRIP